MIGLEQWNRAYAYVSNKEVKEEVLETALHLNCLTGAEIMLRNPLMSNEYASQKVELNQAIKEQFDAHIKSCLDEALDSFKDKSGNYSPYTILLKEHYFSTLSACQERLLKQGKPPEERHAILIKLINKTIYNDLKSFTIHPSLTPIISHQLERIRLSNRLAFKLNHPSNDQVEDTIRSMQICLEIASKKKKPPHKVKTKELETYKKELQDKAEKQAKKNFECLMSEKPKKRTPCPVKNQELSLKKLSLEELEPLEELEEPLHIEYTHDELRAQYIAEIYQRHVYKEHPRVIRWIKASIEEIRRFGKSYAHLTIHELLDQKRSHSPIGAELIISDEQDREIYAFPTTKGLGIIASLITEVEGEQIELTGAIYFGIDNTLIYHKQFVQIKFNNHISQIFRDEQSKIESQFQDENILEKKEWTLIGNVEISVSSDGVFTLQYPSEDYFFKIYPLYPNLLNAKLFKKS